MSHRTNDKEQFCPWLLLACNWSPLAGWGFQPSFPLNLIFLSTFYPAPVLAGCPSCPFQDEGRTEQGTNVTCTSSSLRGLFYGSLCWKLDPLFSGESSDFFPCIKIKSWRL